MAATVRVDDTTKMERCGVSPIWLSVFFRETYSMHDMMQQRLQMGPCIGWALLERRGSWLLL